VLVLPGPYTNWNDGSGRRFLRAVPGRKVMNETDRIGDLNQIVHRLCDELRAGFKIFQSEGREREGVGY